jgi:hypothetical protein
MSILEQDIGPLVVNVEVAGELLGLGRQAAYAAAKAGALPVLPGPGKLRIPVARLETLLGRRLTAADIRAAESRIAPRRDAMLKYQRQYHSAKKAVA